MGKQQGLDAIFAMPDNTIEEMIRTSALSYRKIYFDCEFDRESVFKAMYYIDRIVKLDAKNGIKDEDKIITLEISSYGGFIIEGLGLISKIKYLQEHRGYTFIADTHFAMSMGFVLAIVCKCRRMDRYGTIILHQLNGGVGGKYQDMVDDLEESKRLLYVLYDIIVEHTNITLDKLEEMTRHKYDWYLGSAQALQLNCIDTIM